MEKSFGQTLIFWGFFILSLLALIAPLVVPTAAPFIIQGAEQFLLFFLNTLPFLIFGSLAAGVIDTYLTTETIKANTPQTLIGGLLTAAFLGFAIPLGPVGIIPVVWALFRKGLPSHLAITLLLAAPAVNPITLLAITTHLGLATAITVTILSPVIALTLGAIAYQSPQQFAFTLHTSSDPTTDTTSTSWQTVITAADTLFIILPYFVLGCLLAAVWHLSQLTPILMSTLPAPIAILLSALFSAHHPLLGAFITNQSAVYITLSTMFNLTTITTLWPIVRSRTIGTLTLILLLLNLLFSLILNLFT